MKLLAITLFALVTSVALAQDFPTLPEQVQNRIEDNKIFGRDYYDGVYAILNVELDKLTPQDVVALRQKLQANVRIKHFTLDQEGRQLYIKAEGRFTIKDVKAMTVETSGSIENFTINYTTEL